MRGCCALNKFHRSIRGCVQLDRLARLGLQIEDYNDGELEKKTDFNIKYHI